MIGGLKERLGRAGWMAAALGAATVALGSAAPPTVSDHAPNVEKLQVSFAGDVLPIFQQRCAECHGAEDDNGEVRIEASLNLLDYESTMAGSEFGPVIEAGDPDASFLLEMVVEGDMPEEGDPVPEAEIEVIRQWIQAGAPNN